MSQETPLSRMSVLSQPDSPFTELHEEVRLALVQLPFPAYLALVRQILTSSGYASVRSLGKGISRQSLSIGGFDLLGFCHTDLTTGLTAIQIKQYSGIVARRFVDELRGAMLRLGAESGLLVVTGQFSQAAREAALATPAFPIRLLDGRELASRLVERGEGVCIISLPKRPSQEVGWGVDREYFARLAAQVANLASPTVAPVSKGASQQTSKPRSTKTKIVSATKPIVGEAVR